MTFGTSCKETTINENIELNIITELTCGEKGTNTTPVYRSDIGCSTNPECETFTICKLKIDMLNQQVELMQMMGV